MSYPQADLMDRERLVREHIGLVNRIAYHLLGRLPASVQMEDLTQAGVIGLLEASRQYDVSQGASFETYAGIRIRGAMLDELRRMDWAPRSVHRKARQMADAVTEVENREGRPAAAAEIAEQLGVGVDEYHDWLADVAGQRIFNMEDLLPPDGNAEELFADPGAVAPGEAVEEEDFKRALAEAIGKLPEREKLVLSLYYDEELNLREIGEVLGVSESRVSQINSQALVRLRAHMGEWIGGGRGARTA